MNPISPLKQNQPKGNASTNDDDTAVRRQPTQSNRNFKEVMRKNSEGDKDSDTAAVDDEELVDTPSSLYAKMFSKKTMGKDEELQPPLVGAADEDLSKPKESGAKINPEDALHEALTANPDTSKRVGAKDDSTERHFGKSKDEQEKMEIGAVDPSKVSGLYLAGSAHAQSLGAIQEAAPSSRIGTIVKEIEDLVMKVVEKLYTMESAGQKDTVMTLRNLPMFEGATLKITAFDHASKEFNIAFNDLLPNTKQILDSSEMQNALRQSLLDKGYMVHIMIFTTTADPLIPQSENAQQAKDQEQGDQQEQQGQNQQEGQSKRQK